MFITVNSAITSIDVIEENEILGKDDIDDTDVKRVDMRLNINHIIKYSETYDSESETEIVLINDSIVWTDTPPEEIDKMIKEAYLTPIN